MKANYEKIEKVIIEMTKEEARWLKNVMQNPLYDETPEEEHPQNKEVRYKIFHCLKETIGNC